MASDTKVYSCHVNRKSNKIIRTVLFNAAKVVCIATRQESALKTYADRTMMRKRHRGMKLAFSITAGKMGRILYAVLRDCVAFSPDRSKPRHPTSDNNGMLTITDKRLLRRAKNALVRVGTLEQLKGIANNAKYFADALDKVLREN